MSNSRTGTETYGSGSGSVLRGSGSVLRGSGSILSSDLDLGSFAHPMDLFAFICHFDPTKVIVGDREIAEGEMKLLTLTKGRTVPLGLSIKMDDDVLEETIAKDVSEVVVERTKKKRKMKAAEDASGSTLHPKKLREDYHAAGSLLFPVADAPVMTVVVTTTIVVDVFVVLVSKSRVKSRNFENVGDSGSVVRMRAEHTLEKKDKLEDKCAEQAALLSKKDEEIFDMKSLLSMKEVESVEAIRLCGQLAVVEATDETGLASLISQVTQLTSELFGFQLSRDELSSKVSSLESERDRLADQRSSLESTFELFKGRMEAMQDEQATVLGNRVAELDAQLLEMDAHLEEEFYPRFLTTISGRWILTHGLKLVFLKCLQSSEYCHALGQAIGCAINKGIQDGLKAGVDHGKAGSDLFVIEAYDPSAEAKYIDVVNSLGTVDFSLLSELKSKKDASMVDLMDSLRLKGPLAEIPRVEDLQPSSEQLILLIHKGEIKEKCLSLTDVMVPLAELLSSKSLIDEASIFATAEPITTLSTTFTSSGVVPSLSISDYQVLDTKPHDEDPPAETLKKKS
nr:hypothetical protein [Tanacetum cinerariifolium]